VQASVSGSCVRMLTVCAPQFLISQSLLLLLLLRHVDRDDTPKKVKTTFTVLLYMSEGSDSTAFPDFKKEEVPLPEYLHEDAHQWSDVSNGAAMRQALSRGWLDPNANHFRRWPAQMGDMAIFSQDVWHHGTKAVGAGTERLTLFGILTKDHAKRQDDAQIFWSHTRERSCGFIFSRGADVGLPLRSFRLLVCGGAAFVVGCTSAWRTGSSRRSWPRRCGKTTPSSRCTTCRTTSSGRCSRMSSAGRSPPGSPMQRPSSERRRRSRSREGHYSEEDVLSICRTGLQVGKQNTHTTRSNTNDSSMV
jgi:hypothetical protein